MVPLTGLKLAFQTVGQEFYAFMQIKILQYRTAILFNLQFLSDNANKISQQFCPNKPSLF